MSVVAPLVSCHHLSEDGGVNTSLLAALAIYGIFGQNPTYFNHKPRKIRKLSLTHQEHSQHFPNPYPACPTLSLNWQQLFPFSFLLFSSLFFYPTRQQKKCN
jgi:hypothetical protein